MPEDRVMEILKKLNKSPRFADKIGHLRTSTMKDEDLEDCIRRALAVSEGYGNNWDIDPHRVEIYSYVVMPSKPYVPPPLPNRLKEAFNELGIPPFPVEACATDEDCKMDEKGLRRYVKQLALTKVKPTALLPDEIEEFKAWGANSNDIEFFSKRNYLEMSRKERLDCLKNYLQVSGRLKCFTAPPVQKKPPAPSDDNNQASPRKKKRR